MNVEAANARRISPDAVFSYAAIGDALRSPPPPETRFGRA
jgi:hypothetical protein